MAKRVYGLILGKKVKRPELWVINTFMSIAPVAFVKIIRTPDYGFDYESMYGDCRNFDECIQAFNRRMRPIEDFQDANAAEERALDCLQAMFSDPDYSRIESVRDLSDPEEECQEINDFGTFTRNRIELSSFRDASLMDERFTLNPRVATIEEIEANLKIAQRQGYAHGMARAPLEEAHTHLLMAQNAFQTGRCLLTDFERPRSIVMTGQEIKDGIDGEGLHRVFEHMQPKFPGRALIKGLRHALLPI
jgi:hypothetical protein